MTPPRRPPISAGFCETVAAALLLLWRLWILTPREIVRDCTTILAAYWIFTVHAGTSKAWRPVTLLLMAALLGLYAWGQFPRTLEILGLKP